MVPCRSGHSRSLRAFSSPAVASGSLKRSLTAAGRPVLLGRAVLLRRSNPMVLPEDAEWSEGRPCEGPENSVARPLPAGGESIHRTGMEFATRVGRDPAAATTPSAGRS
ncbi:MAG: hypothetical protein AVDCRST_MAG53-2517 [uncultured Solirubrobacteraceae bacterium]|uniref:Uncharacterized protein n=1 Tax=uncultured Solirubrobacteraceae bacterium TaxID=1162706 RepID=A0A6J4SWN1_9ACTN|nr:MAG: hypothetical protein AVDCRST_MAG53-2517 [uncultured Solirubrobacteraceae bacterium]